MDDRLMQDHCPSLQLSLCVCVCVSVYVCSTCLCYGTLGQVSVLQTFQNLWG